MILTRFDEKLCSLIEPNVSTTREHFEVLKVMKDNGIPTIVWISSILSFINDTVENINGILHYCEMTEVEDILCFGMGFTLCEGNREKMVSDPGATLLNEIQIGYYT